MLEREPAGDARRRRLAPEERRKKIVQAAERVFAERGFAGTSMDEVARLAGVTKPVLYDHFESKAALFFAAAEGVRDELLARGKAAGLAGDLEARFRAGIEAFFLFVEERPTGARLLFVVPKTDPVAAEAAAIVQRQARETIAARLSPLLRGRKPWQKDLAALHFQKGLHALAEWWLDNPVIPRSDLVDEAFSLSWLGFAPRE